MSNVLIVYGSTTGNTADIAEYLGGRLRAAGHVADVRDAADVSPDGLCEGRDVALFGCSAWGTDEVELQTDFEPCFASGDSSFEHFCGAVDVIEARLSELGGIQILEGLKLDGNLSSNGSDVEDWANRLLAAL